MTRQGIYYWFLAARPKTLSAGVVPVLTGSALAVQQGSFQPLPAFFCLMFALFAQIAANLSNDYFDFKKNSDTSERLGPKRAAASGWIKPRDLLIGTIVSLTIACLFGLALIPYGGWNLIYVGAVSVVFCLLYTAGPIPLAYIGLGDLLVWIFFGFVPVLFTAYVQFQTWQADALPLEGNSIYAFMTALKSPEFWRAGSWLPGGILIAAAVGLAVDNILVSNNYRDRENDRQARKFTTIVLFGPRFGRYFYLFNGTTAAILTIAYYKISGQADWKIIFPLFYFSLHLRAWRLMLRLRGSALNRLLEVSARNLLVFGVLFFIGSFFN